MVRSRLFHPLPSPRVGSASGLLSGTVWVLSGPLGATSDLKVLSTHQDQACKGSRKVPLSSRALTHAPMCLCSPARSHHYTQVGKSLAFPAHMQTMPGRCPCPVMPTHKLHPSASSPSPLHHRGKCICGQQMPVLGRVRAGAEGPEHP